MARGVFKLFTDASIQGPWRGRLTGDHWQWSRTRVGPAMGAWIGWHDCDPSSRPTVAGQAFLGKRGTQQAEYLAAIHGLQAVLAYADLEIVPEQLILHVDNKWLANVLEGFWVADKLRSYDRHAKQIVSALEALGVEFFVDRVSEGHAQHKAAHRMSKAAWNQVFDELTWRPAPRPSAPPWAPPTSTRPGTEVDFTTD